MSNEILEKIYSAMPERERRAEKKRLEREITALKNGIDRAENLLSRMRILDEEIAFHEKELRALKRQQALAEKEAQIVLFGPNA